MPVVIARQEKPLFSNHLRIRRKRIVKALWVVLFVLVLYTVFTRLHQRRVERVDVSDDVEGYSTHEQRVAWLKEIQRKQKGPPAVVKLTIYDVCSGACYPTNSSDIPAVIPYVAVEHIDVDAKSVSLDQPPIPIIGTDEEHRRLVSAWDVADFMTHVRVWRAVFHGDGGVGIFLSCRVKDPLPVLKALRRDNWFRNETEGGTMGKDSWDILLLGAGREFAVPTGSVQSRVVSEDGIGEEDLLGYAVSQRGANRLLSYVRAYTVPIKDFMLVVLEKDVEMLRWDGAGLGHLEICETDKGETRDSMTLPFYPPVHWIHAAARDKR